jgi:hypothetical protein
MSTEQDKLKHSKRLLKDEAAVKKQVDIAKAHGFPVGPEHRLGKIHATTCGSSTCAMCGNPRKFFNEKSIQEKSFDQTTDWSDSEESHE